MNRSVTAVDGFKGGHFTHDEARTGCTVLICEGGATAGVDIRGAAPATHETEGLRPGRLTQTAHGLLLTGGSAFGLHAAGGVQQYLEEQEIGFHTGHFRVPIVPAAGIYDLGVGDGSVRPNPKMGYEAARNASGDSLPGGRVGAGTGATVGKAFGPRFMQDGGLGTAYLELKAGVTLGAVVVVNVVGDIIDPNTGEIIAGAYDEEKNEFLDGANKILSLDEEEYPGFAENTIIGAVVTNVDLTCEDCVGIAESAYAGVARCVRPAGTMSDGDAMFMLSSGTVEAKLPRDTLKAAGARVVEQAILSLFPTE